jgi:hypothetical protein
LLRDPPSSHLAPGVTADTYINPLLRSIIRDQGKWDLDKLEDQIREVLSEEE